MTSLVLSLYVGGEANPGSAGFHYPDSDSAPVQVDGSAELELKVDANGNLQGHLSLLSEQPPFSWVW